MRTGERGFTYLWLLFLVAISAALLAVAGQRWSHTVARERERELLFRGGEIAAAIGAYRAAGAGSGPRSLDDLIDDRRSPQLKRHLRRVYTDPFTGSADWEPVLADDGSWRGVRSRSEAPALMLAPDAERREPGRGARISDHLFVEPPGSPAVPATAASGVPADASQVGDPDPNGPWSEPGVKRQSLPAASLSQLKYTIQ